METQIDTQINRQMYGQMDVQIDREKKSEGRNVKRDRTLESLETEIQSARDLRTSAA